MTLISIIISLAVERFLHIGDALKRFAWFKMYADWLRSVLKADVLWGQWQAIAVLLVPLLVIAALLYYIVYAISGIIGYLVLSTLVLIYCLGPQGFFQHAQTLVDSQANTDEKATQSADRTVMEGLFTQANSSVFAVIFWFVLLAPLGPLGLLSALFYRLVDVLRDLGETTDSEYQFLAGTAGCIQHYLDWIPVRLTGLLYVLVGNFNDGFKAWLPYLKTGVTENKAALTHTAFASLGVRKQDKKLPDYQAATDLIDRAFIVLIVVVAVFVLGSWLY